MTKFVMKGQLVFEADDLVDAFEWLRKYFEDRVTELREDSEIEDGALIGTDIVIEPLDS